MRPSFWTARFTRVVLAEPRATRHVLLLALCAALLGCVEDKPKFKAVPPPSKADAGPRTPMAKHDGCVKTGAIDAIVMDPTCEVEEASVDVNRAAMKRVVLSLTPDVPAVPTGTNVIFRLVLTNTSSTEVALVFDAPSTTTGVKPDWSRLSGVPLPKGVVVDENRLPFHVRTLDARDHNVDGLPSTLIGEPSPKLVRVRLPPGGRLTRAISWWALRIPAPMPIYHDDAGHRIVPKTAPVTLPVGNYAVTVEVPLHGLCPAECAVRAPIAVERATHKP